MKKLLLACLALTFLLCLLPTKAEAATSGFCGELVTWSLDDNGTLTISGPGAMWDWSSYRDVPWYSSSSSVKTVVIDDGVTSIGDRAFYRCNALTNATIASSVKRIGDSAFYGCTNLTDVYVTDPSAWCKVSFVDTYANPMYYGKNLHVLDKNGGEVTELILDNTVTVIPDLAFKGSVITTVTIPKSVTTIGENAFYKCEALVSVTIPNSVTGIGGGAFAICSKLTDVYITDPSAWCKVSFEQYDANPMWRGKCLHILDKNGDEVTELTLDNTVTVIPDYAFKGSVITALTIPDSVTNIGEYAFRECGVLTDVTIGRGVTSIGYDAFRGCENITDVYITDPSAWCKISFGNNFYAYPTYYADNLHILDENGNKVTKLTLDNAVTVIPDYAFKGSAITEATIPDSVTTIGESAFRDCMALTDVTIGDGVTSIEYYAFKDCDALVSVYITDMAAWLGIQFGMFDSNPLYQGANLYLNSKLVTELTIPDGITGINAYAFYNYDTLISVTIPASMTSISYDAFNFCDNLATVYYAGTETQWDAVNVGNKNVPLTSATIHYAHVHDYTVCAVVDPTCTEQGYTEYACVFGETYREYVAALGHATGSNAVITPPSCAGLGYTTSNCARCGQTAKTDVVQALGHDYTGPVGKVEPTCTAEGYTGNTCTRCNGVEKTTTIAATGHNMVVKPAVRPTCTRPGLTAGKVCLVCGEVSVAQQEQDPIDHTYADGKCTSCGAEETKPTSPGIQEQGNYLKHSGLLWLLAVAFVVVAAVVYLPMLLGKKKKTQPQEQNSLDKQQ